MYMHVDIVTNGNIWHFFNDLSDKDEMRCMIAGDFNARSREWDNETENIQEVTLSQATLNKDLTRLNDRRPRKLASMPRDTDGVKNRLGTGLQY